MRDTQCKCRERFISAAEAERGYCDLCAIWANVRLGTISMIEAWDADERLQAERRAIRPRRQQPYLRIVGGTEAKKRPGQRRRGDADRTTRRKDPC